VPGKLGTERLKFMVPVRDIHLVNLLVLVRK
jgi:hypothetical protein